MKTWLKGGLIGLVVGILSRIIPRIDPTYPVLENIFRWPIRIITSPFNFLDSFFNTIFTPFGPIIKGFIWDLIPLFILFSLGGYLYSKNKGWFILFVGIYIPICIFGSLFLWGD